MRATHYSYYINFELSGNPSDLLEEIGLIDNKPNRRALASVIANLKTLQFRKSISSRFMAIRHRTNRRKLDCLQNRNPFNLKSRGIIRVLRALQDNDYLDFYSERIGPEGKHSTSEWSLTEYGMDLINELKGRLIMTGPNSYIPTTTGFDPAMRRFIKANPWLEFLLEWNEFLHGHEVGHVNADEAMFQFFKLERTYRQGDKYPLGRYYAAWQTLSKEERSGILINGEPVVELDYKALHPAILYAEEGLCIFDETPDPYADVEIVADPVENRKLVKHMFLCMMATTSSLNAARAVVAKDGELNLATVRAAADRMAEVHGKIASKLYGGKQYPLRMQYLDSLICEEVMKLAFYEGILVLPVHDSFICTKRHQDAVTAIMHKAFEKFYPGIMPKVEVANRKVKLG